MKYRVLLMNAESEVRSDQTIITDGDVLDHLDELILGEDSELSEGDTIEIRVFD